MKRYLKVASLLLVLTSSIYLPAVSAANSTEMLITLAETNPALVERLNDVALNDAKLLKQLLKMADSDPAQLERLLNILASDPETFGQLVTVFNAEETQEDDDVSTFGIDDGGLKG